MGTNEDALEQAQRGDESSEQTVGSAPPRQRRLRRAPGCFLQGLAWFVRVHPLLPLVPFALAEIVMVILAAQREKGRRSIEAAQEELKNPEFGQSQAERLIMRPGRSVP